MAELIKQGATVAYYDPLFPTATLDDGTTLIGVDEPTAFDADLVLVHTAHAAVSTSTGSPEQPLVLDAHRTGCTRTRTNRVVL